jgi:hypothetical protein
VQCLRIDVMPTDSTAVRGLLVRRNMRSNHAIETDAMSAWPLASAAHRER